MHGTQIGFTDNYKDLRIQYQTGPNTIQSTLKPYKKNVMSKQN